MTVFQYTPLSQGGSTSSGVGGIIYNVTVKVDVAIAEQWLHWLLNEQAPAMLSTNCFTTYTVVKLLEVDESDGPTFAVQYRAQNIEAYKKFLKESASTFHQQSINKWGHKVVDFSTIMEVIQ